MTAFAEPRHVHLAGGNPQAKARAPAKLAVKESIVLESVLRFLRSHPAVAWVRRMNSGSANLKGFRVRFGFTGCSDIIGQTKDGRFLAIECKSTTGNLTDEQEAFLARVNRHNGIAGMVRSIDDADELLRGRR